YAASMLSFAAWYAASARLMASERKSSGESGARVSLRDAACAGCGGAADFRSNVPAILGFDFRAMTAFLEMEKAAQRAASRCLIALRRRVARMSEATCRANTR